MKNAQEIISDIREGRLPYLFSGVIYTSIPHLAENITDLLEDGVDLYTINSGVERLYMGILSSLEELEENAFGKYVSKTDRVKMTHLVGSKFFKTHIRGCRCTLSEESLKTISSFIKDDKLVSGILAVTKKLNGVLPMEVEVERHVDVSGYITHTFKLYDDGSGGVACFRTLDYA